MENRAGIGQGRGKQMPRTQPIRKLGCGGTRKRLKSKRGVFIKYKRKGIYWSTAAAVTGDGNFRSDILRYRISKSCFKISLDVPSRRRHLLGDVVGERSRVLEDKTGLPSLSEAGLSDLLSCPAIISLRMSEKQLQMSRYTNRYDSDVLLA
ncbi:hypothetical protein Nepgr_007326 [Nepenthes gracilis]|uniref:Uncharacterized protein n=1 Tax=Nepenthes gracilis TaxID=150966 RepID=A0AAD3S702_NEPGR|nr:hypothetical protein Nepgr_007326 [Nepenthes gracilis]